MTSPSDETRRHLGEGREEVGGAASSAKHPPHVAENAADDAMQAESASPTEIPVLPANASGKDRVSASEQAQPIDDESMYDRRPGEDKDQPPSDQGG